MKIVGVVAVIAVAVGLPAFAQEQAPAPVPIEAWPLDRISDMGLAIYKQDVAAWVSTDALIEHLGDRAPPAGMVGWVVVDEGDTQRVRYVRDDGGVLKAAFDVPVRNGTAGSVTEVDEPLPDTQKAQFRARTTAINNIGRLRCSPRFNTVVLKDPASEDWLVWLLTATSDANIVPVGGHYRFRISADGDTVLRRDMLSNGCMNMPRQDAGNETETVGLGVTQIVSDTPVETHVFLSIQNRLPFFVMVEDGVYAVAGTEISKVE